MFDIDDLENEDGVAPRAKMNQQRSRRFRASQEAKEKEIERLEAIKMFEALGHSISDEQKNKVSWDTNAITPGTPFMDLLANSLRYWVALKMNNDPAWANVCPLCSRLSIMADQMVAPSHHIRRKRARRRRA